MPPETETGAMPSTKPANNITKIHPWLDFLWNERHLFKNPSVLIVILIVIIGFIWVGKKLYEEVLAEKNISYESLKQSIAINEKYYSDIIAKKDAEIELLKQSNTQQEKNYSEIFTEKNATIESLKQSSDAQSKWPTILPPTVITQFVETSSIVTQMEIVTQLVSEVGSVEATRFVYCQVTNLINGQKIVLEDAPIPQTVKIWVNLDFARLVMLNKNASLDGNIITLTNFSSPQVKLIRDRVNNGVVFVEYIKQLSDKSPIN